MPEVLKLSAREIQILHLLARGYDNRQIAMDCQITEQTIKNYVTRLLRKLGAVNRTDAVIRAARAGLIQLNSE